MPGVLSQTGMDIMYCLAFGVPVPSLLASLKSVFLLHWNCCGCGGHVLAMRFVERSSHTYPSKIRQKYFVEFCDTPNYVGLGNI